MAHFNLHSIVVTSFVVASSVFLFLLLVVCQYCPRYCWLKGVSLTAEVPIYRAQWNSIVEFITFVQRISTKTVHYIHNSYFHAQISFSVYSNIFFFAAHMHFENVPKRSCRFTAPRLYFIFGKWHWMYVCVCAPAFVSAGYIYRITPASIAQTEFMIYRL